MEIYLEFQINENIRTNKEVLLINVSEQDSGNNQNGFGRMNSVSSVYSEAQLKQGNEGGGRGLGL